MNKNVIRDQILSIRDSGVVNMFDVRAVEQIAEEKGFAELCAYMKNDKAGYLNFIFNGIIEVTN